MEKLLLFIKHKLVFVWNIIESINNFLFRIIYKSSLDRTLPGILADFRQEPFHYRRLTSEDVGKLYRMIHNQILSDLNYFKPHPYDKNSILKQLKKQSFLMMGAFNDDTLVGYFFIRFFANRKCFVGRLIDKEYRGRGIGGGMNKIMYETAWRMGFHCLSTISRRNTAVMRAHAKNQSMIIRKELQNDYLLVEFVRDAQGIRKRSNR